jgi:glutathione S-transferase
MAELILHHYDTSPFSEKFRLILGHKGLAWRSVKVPRIMPKPDVVALTGGYRRTPFLQVGADIYCDSALMARVVDRLHPTPPLYPDAAGPMQHVLAQWADTALFWTAIPYTMQPAGAAHIFEGAPPEAVKAFAIDRAAMTQGMRRPTPADATANLGTYLAWLEALLTDGRGYLCGTEPCIADFSVAQSPWFIRRAPPVAGVLALYPLLSAWYERIAAFGHGRPEPMTSAEALEVAAGAGGFAPTQVAEGSPLPAGAAVTVSATDYASDLVEGELVGLQPDEIVIARSDPRAGRVHVHFSRIGYQLMAAPTKAQP